MLLLVVGLVVGGAGGAFALLTMSKGKLETLNKQLEGATKESAEQATALATAKDQAKAAKERTSSVEKELGQARERGDKLSAELKAAKEGAEEAAKKAKAELTTEKEKISALETKLSASDGELTKAKAEKQTAEKAVAERKAEADKARAEGDKARADADRTKAELEQARADAAKAQSSADKLAAEISQLHGELETARKSGGSNGKASVDNRAMFAKANGSLDEILRILIETEGQDAAVIADLHGSILASAGDSALKEGIAIAAGRIAKLSSQLGSVVPLQGISSFSIGDDKDCVFSGRAMNCSGELVAVATMGKRSPSDGNFDGAAANINATLNR